MYTYFIQSSKTDQEEDGESGKGSSLPQSPAPGSSPKTSNLEEHIEERRRNGNYLTSVPSLYDLSLYTLNDLYYPI